MAKNVIDAIVAAAEKARHGDGTDYRVLPVTAVDTIARNLGLTTRNIEIGALENGVVPERYARNLKTYTCRQQAALLRSRVTVVGLGGLGGTVVEILARAGVGQLSLVDGDRFEGHNLNRQIICTPALLSHPKAPAAARRVASVNPSVEVTTHPEFLAEANSGRLLTGTDVVVDCLDNLPDRFLLEAAAKKSRTPLVSAAVAGLSGHITTIFPEDQGLTLIYGPPEESSPKGVETTLGCLPQAVMLVAAIECAEVSKILLSQPDLLRNHLLLIDLTDNSFEKIRLA